MTALRPPAFLSGRDAAAVRPAAFAAPSVLARAFPRDAGPAVASAGEPRAAEPRPAPELAAPPERSRAPSLERVSHAVEVLRLRADLLAEQARTDALELGFLVARRILDAEIATSPDAVLSLVRTALRRASDSRRVAIRVHPADAKAIDGHAAGGGLGLSTATVEVVADPDLERGDVVVETDFGKVDGRLRTRLAELQRAVASALEEGAA